MFSFFKSIFSNECGYEAQKRKLGSGDHAQLLALAQSEKTNPEILYLLASDKNDDVRRAVAQNKATPVHAAALMAKDADENVRLKLAARLVTLLPALDADRHGQLYAFAVQAMGVLTQDEVVQVRKALSSALKDYAKAPPDVVNRLARDVEREVAEPILRFCVALEDDQLLEIIGSHPAPWVIGAIAARAHVSENVSTVIVDSQDAAAVSILLKNATCVISVQKLNEIIERAREYPDWHRPIALRRELSLELANRLAGFVDKTVLEVLEKRSDFDAATRQGIADMVKRRLEFMREDTQTENAAARVERYVREKRLTAEVLGDAIAWHDTEFAILALAYMAAIHPQIVRRMIEAKKPRPVVALCRKAGLAMRVAVDAQRLLAKVPQSEILYAKDGTDYPLSDADITWQLEFFGVHAALA